MTRNPGTRDKMLVRSSVIMSAVNSAGPPAPPPFVNGSTWRRGGRERNLAAPNPYDHGGGLGLGIAVQLPPQQRLECLGLGKGVVLAAITRIQPQRQPLPILAQRVECNEALGGGDGL